MTNDNINDKFTTGDLVDLAELLKLVTGEGPQFARFELSDSYRALINEDVEEVLHLLVSAAHEGYMMGLAHGAGIPREDADQPDVELYAAMTFACKDAVNEYQAQNPAGFC